MSLTVLAVRDILGYLILDHRFGLLRDVRQRAVLVGVLAFARKIGWTPHAL